MEPERDFIQMIKAHEGLIFKVTKLFSNHPEDQKDLYQEIVYQLWKSMESYNGKAKRSTWIYRVALNTAIALQKQQNKRKPHVPFEADLLKIIEEKDQAIEEQIQQLYQIIQTLPLMDRGIILLVLEGLNYQSIAEIIGISTSNVGTRLQRIKTKLKAQFKTAESWS